MCIKTHGIETVHYLKRAIEQDDRGAMGRKTYKDEQNLSSSPIIMIKLLH